MLEIPGSLGFALLLFAFLDYSLPLAGALSLLIILVLLDC